MPHLPAGQHVDYMFQTKTTAVWKKLFDAGKLNEAQSLFWKAPRAPEELYDLQSDPDEVKNLAGSPEHRKTLAKLRQAQREHALKIRDVGFLPEDEIHMRSAPGSPYEMGHDAKKYPLENILDMAEIASFLQTDALPKLHDGLKAGDSALRYWAAMGMLMRGKDGVAKNTDALRGSLKDASPSVRIVAAEALAQFGGKDDAAASLAALVELGDPRKNSIYLSLAALNALDRLGEKALPALPALKDWPTEGMPASHRAGPGIARLLARIRG
jgi:uncharacterized sulfatase